jgi:hypothetical protein
VLHYVSDHGGSKWRVHELDSAYPNAFRKFDPVTVFAENLAKIQLLYL